MKHADKGTVSAQNPHGAKFRKLSQEALLLTTSIHHERLCPPPLGQVLLASRTAPVPAQDTAHSHQLDSVHRHPGRPPRALGCAHSARAHQRVPASAPAGLRNGPNSRSVGAETVQPSSPRTRAPERGTASTPERAAQLATQPSLIRVRLGGHSSQGGRGDV